MGENYIEDDEPLVAAYPQHPGVVLKETLADRSVAGVTLAAAIGAERAFITKMLNGQKAVSSSMALKIERAIGYPAELLVAMQSQFDLAEARRKDAAALERIEPIGVAA